MTDGPITLDEARRREADRASVPGDMTDAPPLPAGEDDYGVDAPPPTVPWTAPDDADSIYGDAEGAGAVNCQNARRGSGGNLRTQQSLPRLKTAKEFVADFTRPTT